MGTHKIGKAISGISLASSSIAGKCSSLFELFFSIRTFFGISTKLNSQPSFFLSHSRARKTDIRFASVERNISNRRKQEAESVECKLSNSKVLSQVLSANLFSLLTLSPALAAGPSPISGMSLCYGAQSI